MKKLFVQFFKGPLLIPTEPARLIFCGELRWLGRFVAVMPRISRHNLTLSPCATRYRIQGLEGINQPRDRSDFLGSILSAGIYSDCRGFASVAVDVTVPEKNP